MYGQQAPKGNAGTCIALLHQLHQHCPAQLLVRILENGSIHRSQTVTAFVAHMPWWALQPLAPYRPEDNPLERFWQWLTSKVSGGNSYKTMDEVVSKIRKLIWHYHAGRLLTTIRFNCSASAELL